MKNEYGRSMIEMLGVLAIIGVLSIGGLAGYTMAMNRHKANQVLDYVSRCAVIAQTKGDGSTAFTAEDCYTLLGNEEEPAALVGTDHDAKATAARAEGGTVTVTVNTSADIKKIVENRKTNAGGVNFALTVTTPAS